MVVVQYTEEKLVRYMHGFMTGLDDKKAFSRRMTPGINSLSIKEGGEMYIKTCPIIVSSVLKRLFDPPEVLLLHLLHHHKKGGKSISVIVFLHGRPKNPAVFPSSSRPVVVRCCCTRSSHYCRWE